MELSTKRQPGGGASHSPDTGEAFSHRVRADRHDRTDRCTAV